MRAGLCDRCRHQQVVTTTRSMFSMCLLFKTDARFAKYPTIPVLRCAGFAPRDTPVD
jgi:hypothetical protein